MDDILDMMDGDDKPFKPAETAAVTQNSGKKKNMWEETDIELVKIDPEKMEKPEQVFTIGWYNDRKDLPESVSDKFVEVSKALFSKGYTVRLDGEKTNTVNEEIMSMPNSKYKVYLPWKKFNQDIENPKISQPAECAYKFAVGIDKFFLSTKPAGRAMRARLISMVVGHECKTPAKFLLIYTSCGVEALPKGTNYKTIGPNLSLSMRAAIQSNIPIFNLQKEDAVKRLSEMLKQ